MVPTLWSLHCKNIPNPLYDQHTEPYIGLTINWLHYTTCTMSPTLWSLHCRPHLLYAMYTPHTLCLLYHRLQFYKPYFLHPLWYLHCSNNDLNFSPQYAIPTIGTTPRQLHYGSSNESSTRLNTVLYLHCRTYTTGLTK